MKSYGKSTFVHATANGPWSESATRETGHATPEACEGDEREKRLWERSPVEPPISLEGDPQITSCRDRGVYRGRVSEQKRLL